MTVGFLGEPRAYFKCSIIETLQDNGKKQKEENIEVKQFSEVSVFSGVIVPSLDRGLTLGKLQDVVDLLYVLEFIFRLK